MHGNADSHLDALCHVVYDGTLYNEVPAANWTAEGAGQLSIAVADQGIAGRAVLLDIPRVRGIDWLEPGRPRDGRRPDQGRSGAGRSR